MKRFLILSTGFFFFLSCPARAQVVTMNGIYLTINNGTVVNTDTIYNNSGSLISNEATMSIASVFNLGTLQGSGTYLVRNIFSNSGVFTPNSSTVSFNGSIDQGIPGLLYYNLSTSGSGTKNITGSVSLTNILSIGSNTTLSLGSNNIRLKSDSTYTARISTMDASAVVTYGTGRFIAERFVKGRRKYRLFTSPVTSSPNATLTAGEENLSLWANWQNSGSNSTANTGTFITGGSAADGFDTQTSNASLFTYNSSTRAFTGFTSANGKNTKYTPLKAGVPYYMFIWGDRTNSLITTNPNKTVISSKGKILTGDQTYNSSSSIPLTNTVNGFSLIGNPFASPVDWATISRTNLSDTYWGWDPNLNSTGGYVTVTSTGTVTLVSPFSGAVGLSQQIQSGQAFFVKTTGASPVLTIKETDKVGNFNALAFRTEANNIPLIAINLFYDEGNLHTLMDGALAAFDPDFGQEVNNEDAVKLSRPGEELSILHDGSLLSIDQRKMPSHGDTIFLQSGSLSKNSYRLQVFSKYLEQYPVKAWLEDNYLKKAVRLSWSDTNHINFNVNKSVAASFDAKRFRIVFGESAFNSTGISQPTVRAKIKIEESNNNDNLVKFMVPGAEAGKYDCLLFNSAGQLITKQSLIIENGNVVQRIHLPSSLAPGTYYLELSNRDTRLTAAFILH